MLEALGITFVALIVAVFSFVSTIRLLDGRGWWADAGLAGIIPMLLISIPVSLTLAAIAVWVCL